MTSVDNDVVQTSPLNFSTTNDTAVLSGEGQDGVVTEQDAATSTQVADVAEAPVTAPVSDTPASGVSVVGEPVADSSNSASPSMETDNEIESLQAQKDRLEAEIEERQKAKRSTVIAEIKKVVDSYKIPVSELVAALGGVPNPRKGTKAKAKYRDGAGNTWSGRGRAPKWLEGRDKNEFLITE